MRQKKRKSNEKWTDFERRVKTVFESMGYRVEHDVLLGSSQVDLVATQEARFHTERYAIECKDYDTHVGIDEARRFHSTVDSISSRSFMYRGIIITTKGFTKEAKAFAHNVGLVLQTWAEVSNRSFDPFSLVTSLIDNFDRNDLSHTYIPLSCQVTDTGKGTVYKPVEKFLDSFFSKTRKIGVAVLGNFGTGKSSLCRHYAYLLAKRWHQSVEKNSVTVPLLVSLRDCRTFERFSEELLRYLNSVCDQEASLESVIYWLRSGRTILLLDGFDEMAAHMDRISIDRELEHLQRFISSNSVKVILTCRTHFFKSQVQEDALGNMLRLYILDWGKKELRDYVSKKLPDECEKALQIIGTTYNLEELSKTPIFADMITTSINGICGDISSARLYEVYTANWFAAQEKYSRICVEDMRTVMTQLSMLMYKSGSHRISYENIPQLASKYLSFLDPKLSQLYDQDIRTRSFLVRNEKGEYYFVHKSFMEYFVAYRLAESVKQNDLSLFGELSISHEVTQFFASWFERDAEVFYRIVLSAESGIARSNSALALGYLPWSEKAERILTAALEIENDPRSLESIVRSLVAWGKEASVKSVIGALDRLPVKVADLAFAELGKAIAFEFVKELYQRCAVDLGQENRCLLAIRVLTEEAEYLAKRVLSFMFDQVSLWSKNRRVVNEIFRSTAFLCDASLLKKVKEAVNDTGLSHFKKEIRELADTLWKKELPAVQRMARRSKHAGMEHKQAMGEIYGYLGFIAASHGDEVSTILAREYGGSSQSRGRRTKKHQALKSTSYADNPMSR